MKKQKFDYYLHKMNDGRANMDELWISLNESASQEDITKFLVDSLIPSQADLIRINSVRLLSKIDKHQSFQILKNYLSDNHISVRVAVAEALGDIRIIDTIPILVYQLQQEKEEDVREAIIGSLGIISSDCLLPIFFNALTDEGSFVREAAFDAIYNLSTKPYEQTLNRLKTTNNDTELQELIYVLEALENKKAIPILQSLLSTENKSIKYAVNSALEKLSSIE